MGDEKRSEGAVWRGTRKGYAGAGETDARGLTRQGSAGCSCQDETGPSCEGDSKRSGQGGSAYREAEWSAAEAEDAT